MQRVIVQSDSVGRMHAQDILSYNVKNSQGRLVPLSSFATIKWMVGPTQIVGFNYYPSVRSPAKPSPATPRAMRSRRWKS
jgi:multidrug efflux pump